MGGDEGPPGVDSMSIRGLLQYRKDPRVIVALPVLFLIVTSGVYYLVERAKDLSPEALSSRLLLFVLWNINLVLIIGVVFVLLRGVVKVLLERQRGLLGSRFRSRLVATYVATSLVPIVLLFLVATDLLRVSIDRWFTSPVQTILDNSEQIAQLAQQQAVERAAAAGRAAADSIARGERTDRALERVRQTHGVEMVSLYEAGVLVDMKADPRAPVFEAPDPPAAFFEELRPGIPTTKIDLGLRGKWLRSAITAGNGQVIVAGVFFPAATSRMLDENILAYQQFQQLDTQKEAFKTSQTGLFLAITLSILFGTLWTAMYASRRITGPVVALAEGTRTLAEGDLDHRITVRANDEFAQLIDSFNRMAEEIQSKRVALTASNDELQRLNRQVDEERAYLSTVLESVSAGILALSRDETVLSANRAAVRILGLDVAPEGRSLATLLQEGAMPLLDVLRDPASRGRAREVTITTGGELRYLEVSIARFEGDSDEDAVVVALEDLTQLVQAQKLAAWSEAARRIAHEIKNPLTPIQLSAERLLRKANARDADLPGVAERASATIIGEVHQLKRMVDEFSRFARMPAVHLRHTRVCDVLQAAVELYRDTKPDVRLEIDCDDSIAALIDPEQIRRVLVNLIDNAIEATDAGFVRVSARSESNALIIEVADTGRGIDDADKEKLFSPYFSTKDRGTGLGLAIVHRIVHDHDGRISVHDNHPAGSRFEIVLPA